MLSLSLSLSLTHKEWKGEAKEWEKEVLHLKEVVQALEWGKQEEEEELCRLAAALADMQDGITEERREWKGKEIEWERENTILRQEVARVMGGLRVEMKVHIPHKLSLSYTHKHKLKRLV